jgi:hypothetical protein
MLAPGLVGPEKRPQSAAQQNQWGAEGKERELRCTTGKCVERRPTTRANPYRGDCQEYDRSHPDDDAESDCIANTVADIRVAVTQVFSSAVHR